MATAGRSFQMAAKSQVGEKDSEYPPIPYTLVDEEGVETVVTAHYPGDGALTMLMADFSSTDSISEDSIDTFFNLIARAFDPDGVRYIRAKIKSGELSLEMVTEIIGDMVEQWTAFPTPPSSASTPSRNGTGARSTGRAPGKGSTQQRSLPAGS